MDVQICESFAIIMAQIEWQRKGLSHQFHSHYYRMCAPARRARLTTRLNQSMARSLECWKRLMDSGHTVHGESQ
jgi:hypothetical protein